MKKKKSSKNFFVPRSLKTTRKNRTSPNTGTIKKFFHKTYFLSITNNEKVQISKSKPKKSQSCVPLNKLYKDDKGAWINDM